jgi:hypothetical protein
MTPALHSSGMFLILSRIRFFSALTFLQISGLQQVELYWPMTGFFSQLSVNLAVISFEGMHSGSKSCSITADKSSSKLLMRLTMHSSLLSYTMNGLNTRGFHMVVSPAAFFSSVMKAHISSHREHPHLHFLGQWFVKSLHDLCCDTIMAGHYDFF